MLRPDSSPRHGLRGARTWHPPTTDTSTPTALLEIRGAAKVFSNGEHGEIEAVSGLSLAIDEASAVLLTGPSGSGKSTALGLIGCLIRPTSGRITVAGEEVTRCADDRLSGLRRSFFGFVFQALHLIRGVSAIDNVLVPALPGGESSREIRRRARELLDRLDLGERSEAAVERLSGGERQRVALARALINRPRLLIADEPTAHLDADIARLFLELCHRLVVNGTSVVVASHDPQVCRSPLFGVRVTLRHGRTFREI